MNHDSPTLEQAVRVTQIITGALVMGVVMFAAIAVFAVGVLDDPPDGLIISALGAGFAGVAFVMHLIVPAIMLKQQGNATDAAQLYGLYQTKTIVGLAILEGAAFFNIVATFVEHNWWSLAIAGGLVFWMLALFPTQTRIVHWVETRQMEGS